MLNPQDEKSAGKDGGWSENTEQNERTKLAELMKWFWYHFDLASFWLPALEVDGPEDCKEQKSGSTRRID